MTTSASDMSRATEEMASIDVSDRHSNHVVRVIHDLSRGGWSPIQFPAAGRLLRNCQLVELRAPKKTTRVRISAYKVGGRGEAHRLHQQRIEITTTIGSGLRRTSQWADVVLGYDSGNDVYVGLDPRRIGIGGETHNASTSVDPSALAAASNSHILVRPHRTRAFGLEYQAIFGPQRLSEYLFNQEQIHRGQYRGDGLFSGELRTPKIRQVLNLPLRLCRGTHIAFTCPHVAAPRKRVVKEYLVEASENEDIGKLRDVTPEQLEAVLQRRREVGDAGESFIYDLERKRLTRAGRGNLANKVEWISRKAVGKGYDIKSYETDGTPKFIEVKATIGRGATFFISSNEWTLAKRLHASYWIYRVTTALSDPTLFAVIRDPIGAERNGTIVRVADGWRVKILKRSAQTSA